MFSLCLLYAFLKLLTVFDLFITPGCMFQASTTMVYFLASLPAASSLKIGGLLPKILSQNSKGGQLNICTVYVYCVMCFLFSPVAAVCARVAGNFNQYLTTVISGAYDMVWLMSHISQLASRVGAWG
jgi:hypothetical protein